MDALYFSSTLRLVWIGTLKTLKCSYPRHQPSHSISPSPIPSDHSPVSVVSDTAAAYAIAAPANNSDPFAATEAAAATAAAATAVAEAVHLREVAAADAYDASDDAGSVVQRRRPDGPDRRDLETVEIVAAIAAEAVVVVGAAATTRAAVRLCRWAPATRCDW